MSRRLVQTVGVAAVGGIGYYLYTAGGSPRVAEKQFEKDLSKVGASRSTQAQKQAEEWAQRAGSKLDSAANEAIARANQFDASVQAKLSAAETTLSQGTAEASAKFNEYRKEADKKIESFDKTVEKKAAEAKNGLSSWWSSPKQ